MTSVEEPVRIETERLVLEAPPPGTAAAVLDYYTRNREHFAPWDPVRPPEFFTLPFWQDALARNLAEYRDGVSMRLFLRLRDEPAGIHGSCNLSQITRGAFQSAMLGYSIDRAHEGRGLMSEALRGVTAHAFGALGLHRIQASHVPENVRSARLLERAGFVREGIARDYLRIAGRWRDHVLTALVDPNWTPPPGEGGPL